MRDQRKEAYNKVDHRAGGKRRLHTCHPFEESCTVLCMMEVDCSGGPGMVALRVVVVRIEAEMIE